MTEKRRHPRCTASENTLVFWTDAQGRYWQERAAVGDISSHGICVALRNRIEPRTRVSLKSATNDVTMTACVRYVRQKGLRYFAGLELPTPESNRRE